ncbi:hypothetical protein SR1949_28100 [Sphaerospermopsis reniformis]|uniref:Uncharacterized protein n=1 Tax=Sphaerospermopsis reniformis TaxID=531300 RepID=A0A479ZYC5_9CYAN|nr:hypothetical protein [Sphaerospermopsis reniformis]GCL37699.1 hypothetical protein SR1949_28100 [Sphaerospermopsis reniformis]
MSSFYNPCIDDVCNISKSLNQLLEMSIDTLISALVTAIFITIIVSPDAANLSLYTTP